MKTNKTTGTEYIHPMTEVTSSIENKQQKLQTFIESTQEKYPQVDKDTIKLLVIEVMEYLQEGDKSI